MYTMKIVLFNILLICVISEISATWSTRSLAQRIGSIKEKISEEEAKQDILSLLNIDNEDGTKSVSLQNFPLKKLLKADFSKAPMFETAKKIKSKPQETLEVVPLDKPQTLYPEFNSKYPKQYLTPSQFDDDSQSDEMILNNKNVNSDASESDEMLFVIRLPPNYSYIKGQSLQNKPYKDNIPPLAEGLSVEDMTVLEIPPDIKESKNYYFKPDYKPPINFYHNQYAGGHYYKPKPKHSKFNKKLMQLLKRLLFQSKLKKEMHPMKNPYRVGDNVMGRFTKVIKHNSMTYYDKLKEYLQELVAKLLNKAMKQREDQEKVRRRNYRHRMKRDTQAGYTQDPDTCKKYNDNLEKMWATLSKYLNSTDSVDQQALHNIAVMVEAYMEHQNEKPHLEEVDHYQEKKKDKISEVLTKIRKLLGDENATKKVKEMVLQNFKPEYDDNTECKQTNEDNLLSSIDLSYKNYLDNAKCRGDYDTGLLRGKALLRNGAPMKSKDMSNRQFYDTYVVHKNILDEVETSEEFYKRGIPSNKRYKKRGRFNRRNDRRSFGRSAKLSRYARQFKNRHTGLRHRPKKSSKKRSRPKKSHIRSDEACVKYANRKFLITLRTSIERFMDLRDCHQDDTLRTSNKNRKARIRRRKQALRTPNKRKFNDMTFYTDTELGEKERRRINNYLSNIKDFNDQEINRNKSIFIVHTTSYKSPLLLKLNNKREGMHGYTSNMKQPLGPGYNNKQSKYGFDTIYKSFLESSDKNSFDTLNSKKNLKGGLQSSHIDGRIRNINLYDIIKQKVDQENYKRPFSIVGRQNGGENESLDVEPIHYNNSSDDIPPTNSNDTNLAQNGTSINFEEIGSMLDDVRNSSLQKPQIDASNFISNNDKGYVELSYLIKYPKSIVFRPQYLVKNILQYEEFVKVATQLYVTDEDKQLMKIVRYLPDNKTQVLFETQDFKSPIEVFDVKEDIKKTKPIFSANFSDTNEALRQRTTNQTAIHNYENDNETPVNVLSENRINVDSPLRENDHVNSPPEDKVSAGLILADDLTEDIINTDISNIGTDITRADTLSEDEIHTDLTNEDSLPESSSSTNVSPLLQDNIITNENDREETDDLIKSEINNVNLLRDSKISLDIDKVDHIQEENIATNADRAETLPEEKNESQIFSTDSIQESSINAHASEHDILRNYNNSIDKDQTDHLPDDIINRELNGTIFLRNIEISTDTSRVDSLQEDEDRTSTEQIIGNVLQQVKNNYDVDHTDLLRENNISTIVNRADLVLEGKNPTEDSKEYLHSEDKLSSGLSEIDLLRQKKINPDAYHVDLLHEYLKLNKDDSTDTNEQHLQKGDFNIDLSRSDISKDDKIISDNPSDFLLETNTEEHNVDSLRESNIDIDVDRAYPVILNNVNVEDVSTSLRMEDKTEVNDVYSLRESAINTEVNRESSQLEDKNDNGIAYVALRDDKIITEVSQEDPLQEDENSRVDNEYPPNETKIGLHFNILDNLNNSKIDSAVRHGDSTPENNINTYVNRVDLQNEDISSTGGNLAESPLENTEDTHSLRGSKISVGSNKADSTQDDISTHSVELLPSDKTSTEENMVGSLQQIKINHDVDFSDLLREHNNITDANRLDSLKEDKTNIEVNNTDYLRENKIIVTDYPRGQEETIKAEVNREDLMPDKKNNDADSLRANKITSYIRDEDSFLKDEIHPEHEIQTKIDHLDSLRENQNNLFIKHKSYLPKYSIITENNSADQDKIQTQIYNADSLRNNKINSSINHEDSVQQDNIVAENNHYNLLPEYEIQTKIDDTDSLRETQISPDIKLENYLQKDSIITENNNANQEEIQTQTDHTASLRENIIVPYIKDENSLQIDSIVIENNNADLLPEQKIQTHIDHVDSLRENQISPDIMHENSLQKDSVTAENTNADQDEAQTLRDNANSARENKFSPYIENEDLLPKDSIVAENNNADLLPEQKIQTNIDHLDSLRENQISLFIKDENSLHKDSLISTENNADRVKIQTQTDNTNYLRENKISPKIILDNPLQEDNISTNNNYHDTLADDTNHSKLDNGDTLREIAFNHEVERKHNIHEEKFGLEVKRDYPLAEDKIIDVDNVNPLQESDHIIDANNANLLTEDKITTDSNRDNSLIVNDHSNEFAYSNENLPLGGTNQLRNSKTNPEVDSVGFLHLDSNDKISSEANGVHLDDQTEHLRERITSTEANPSDFLLEDMIDQNFEDVLRGRDTNPDVNHDDPLLEDRHSAEVNSNEYKQSDSKVDHIQNSKIDTGVKDVLREDNMKPEVSTIDLPNNKISTAANGKNIDPLREGETSNEFNRVNLLPADEINAEVGQVDPFQDKISSEIDQEDTLREGIPSDVVNRAELLPEVKIDKGVSVNIPSYEAEIASDVTRSDFLREGNISTDGNTSDTLPIDLNPIEYNNRNILRVTDVNRKDSLTENKIETDTNNENVMPEVKVSSMINNGDPLADDLLKKNLRDDEIKFNVSYEYSPSQNKIDMDDKTDMGVNNLQPDRKDKTNTELNNENQLTIDKISAEISSVTALRNNGFNVSDRLEGEEISTDDYRVNPLLRDSISHEIDNSDSTHVDISPDDNIKTDIARGDTLPGEEKNQDNDRVDPIQEDTTIFEVNTKGFLRESNIDTNIKLTEDRPEDITNIGLNRDILEEDQIRTNVTRSGSLLEDKIVKDDLNLDARKEPRNYTDELDYLSYQDGSIAEGLNTSSNEFERGGNLVESPNPVLNETSYKYNASSALREQVIDAFNDTLNSSEFINRKDDIHLNELNKNISLPDIDAESIADYLRFTLNNAELSLSTASQAYLKELESQGLTNAATTKILLKNWWDAWKNKLTAKVQSIAGRVTNLFKKLDNTSSTNEEPEIKTKFGDI